MEVTISFEHREVRITLYVKILATNHCYFYLLRIGNCEGSPKFQSKEKRSPLREILECISAVEPQVRHLAVMSVETGGKEKWRI